MKTKIMIAAFCWSAFANAQISGNQIYSNSNQYNDQNQIPVFSAYTSKISSNQNSTTYKINVLNTVKANAYVITFGLNQEAISVKDCNAKINSRIQKFKSEIRKIGVETEKETDFYVDFISQTKVYDYDVNRDGSQVNAKQKDVGFEIKKNIIFKITDISKFDALVELAAENEIHNIVKVEYIVKNQDEVYEKMLDEAIKVYEKRRTLEKKTGAKQPQEKPMITVNFVNIQPKDQYKNYQAYESSNVEYSSNYNSDKVFVKQEQRKSKTFYFDGQKTNSYDVIMNDDTALIGVQYSMEVIFTIENPNPKSKDYHLITPNGELKKIVLD